MASPLHLWRAWTALSLQAAQLGWEAQGVIALRMMRLAAPAASGQREARRMVAEKFAAAAEAQAAAAAAAIRGGRHPQVAKKALAVYRKRVRRNRRRLAR